MRATGRKIDGLLPEFDIAAEYGLAISAPPPVVYECLLRADFGQSRIIRILMALRRGRRSQPPPISIDFRQRLRGSGFVELAEVPGQEIVIGVAGKFWRPDGGRCMYLTADNFADFCLPGHVKVAWNFTLTPASKDQTVLATETRAKCFGRSALWKFRLYWFLIGPFSGLIRKSMLKQIKVAAESKSKEPPSL